MRPILEVLEDRTMLDTTLAALAAAGSAGGGNSALLASTPLAASQQSPSALSIAPNIVVGRTLSTYFTGGIQNNQITITCTVYNEQANPETGVLLTDSLQPGVTLQSASQQPDQSGQNLAWSLGTINGFDRASVTVTLGLPSTSPLQIDTGAKAFATLDGAAVSNSTPAATLRQGNVDPSLLASTPDANITDPFIQEEAAKLNFDPQLIFNFLHNDVGYNSYTGSVRGARGTLWSSAGNSLDVASLGVALMRASGIPAQYAQGTLSQGQAQQLIVSMFPSSFQTVGAVPASAKTADPANDPALLSETESHYWFQFDSGSGITDADPIMAGATIGQSFTTATGTFTEVPDTLRAKTEVSLTAEIYSQAAAVFGLNPSQDTVVLDHTFNDVDLVGRPITIGNFVSQSGAGFILSSVTNTYTPYMVVGDDALPDSQLPEAIVGQPYQEVLTNFPLGNQVLTGLFLNVTLSGPGITSQTYTRSLVDRIGYAAQQGLAPSENLSVSPSGPPVITPFDQTTLNVLPGLQSAGAAQLAQERADQELASISSQTAAPPTAAQTEALTAFARAELASFTVASDQETANLASGFSVAAYFSAPRVTAFSTQLITNNNQSSVVFGIDLMHDSIRAVASPGQNAQAPLGFSSARGMFDSFLEAQALSSGPGGQNLSSIAIIQQSIQQSVPLAVITSSNLSLLQTLNLPADAIARITSDVQNGLTVLVPTRALMVNGMQMTAWFDINQITGETIAESTNGGHQALLAWAVTLTGAVSLGIVIQAEIDNVKFNGNLPNWEKAAKTGALNYLAAISGLAVLPFALEGAVLVTAIALVEGVAWGVDGVLSSLDPPLQPVTTDLNLPFPTTPGASASTQIAVQPGQAQGVASGTMQASSAAASGSLTASWASATTSSFLASSLGATAATVVDSQGTNVGSGTVALSTQASTAVSLFGQTQYNVNGQASLSFYGPAETSLGVSGNWNNYSATVTGNVSIALTVPAGALTLNGQALPAGTYTITTSSATLSGSGPSTSPNFSGSASITATNGVINLGPGSGNVTVGGNPLNVGSGAALTGYTGSITVAASGGNNTDNVTLNGNAGNVMTVSATPNALTTDQNTPVTFQANVNTSFADTYNLTATAPQGWKVAIDSKGNVSATPAPGLQGGTYPIQVIAQSATNSDLVARTIVNVTITPTAPGINFSVVPDTQITVPFNGAQLPTAFRASIQNLGPSADTYNLTFANVPTGFTVLDSGTSVTVPAGQTGILGLYLQPNAGQPIPPPGTQLSFTVTATSMADPSISKTQAVTFTVPAIDAITLTSTPTTLNTTLGAPVSATLTLTNAGNVPETVSLADTLPAGLTASSLSPVSLAVGQSMTETVTLTPAASVPLNSTLQATITATYGPSASPQTQTVALPVNVVVPGAAAIANASVAASQLSNTNLANRLSDLSTALTNLVQNPTSAVYKSQALADTDAISGLLAADPFVASAAAGLATPRAELAAATTASAVQTAVTDLGNALQSLAMSLGDEAAHGFTLALSPNSALALPSSPADFGLNLQNNGNQATTYDLSVTGLPGSVTAVFTQNGQSIQKVTLQPGQSLSNVTLALTETGGSLFPTGFTVTATAEGAAEITQSASGTVAVRPTFVAVTEVDPSPPFTNPGTPVDVTAKLFNSVNQQLQAQASYTVTGSGGNVVFTSTPVPLTISVQSALSTVDLGSFSTTGLALGDYAINVTITDSSGKPIPGATGQGSVLIGTPVTASLTTVPTALPSGNGTVTTTLQINGAQSSSGGGTTLYVTNESPTAIQKLDTATNTLTTVLATPDYVDSLIFDNNGDIVYTLLDRGQLGLFNPTTGANGIIASGFNTATDITLEPGGNTVLVTDRGNNRLARVNLTTGAVGTLVDLSTPNGTAYDNQGHLFAVETGTESLVQIDPTTGAILQTIPLNTNGYVDGMTFDPVTGAFWIGNNGGLIEVSNYLASPQVQQFTSPIGGTFDGTESDGKGHIFTADLRNRVVEYTIASNTFTPLTSLAVDDLAPVTGAGAPPLTATVTVPTNNGVTIVPNSFNIAPTTITSGTNSQTLQWDFPASALGATTLYITSPSLPGIQKVDTSSNTVTNVLNTGSQPDSLIFDNRGDVIYSLLAGEVGIYDPSTSTNAILASGFNDPQDLALEPGGNTVLVNDRGNNRIERINLGTGAVSTLPTGISGPEGLTYDGSGNLFVVEGNSHSLLQLDPTTGATLRTIPLNNNGYPDGVTFDPVTGALWVADQNNLIEISNYLSSPQVQQFTLPAPLAGMYFDGVESDGAGNIYIAEYNGGNPGRIDKYSIATNTFTTPTSVPIDDVAPLIGLGAAPGETITWQSAISNLQVGEVRNVTLGGTVNFTSQGTAGTLTLPPTSVVGAQILALNPAVQTVAPATPATYTLTVINPSSSQDTFNLAVLGVPPGWVSLPASVAVAANSSSNVILTLTSDSFAALGDHGFTITANDGKGAMGSVAGDLILAGQPPPVDGQAHGVVVALTPAQATAGLGTAATYTVQVTNTGSADDTFALSIAGLPAGVTAQLNHNSIDVPPGVSNFRDVTLTLTPQPGTTIGSDSFTVTAASTSKPAVTGTTSGTLNVLGNGVSVSLNPPSGAPGTTFQMTVTNTGQTTDTFNLALAGPAALVANLATSQITLAAGASQQVAITTGSVNFAVPGPLTLSATATSQTNPAVTANATATLTIPTITGLTASFNPGSQTVSVPGTGTYLLLVNNTGNAEDAYSATIAATTGPITAHLMGLDGQPAQTVPVFRLPGLSSGAILLQADQTGHGQGTVTVMVQSLDHANLSAAPTAVQTAPSPAPAPTPAPAPSPPAPAKKSWIVGLEVHGLAAVGLAQYPPLQVHNLMFGYFPALSQQTWGLMATLAADGLIEEMLVNSLGGMFVSMAQLTQQTAGLLQLSWLGLWPLFAMEASVAAPAPGLLSAQVFNGQKMQSFATPFFPLSAK
jgi:uncharacterized membrane protein/sugar lactone lactonase YvrE